MSLVFFGIGFIIFSIYLILLVWNIIYNGNKQEEENYPNLDYVFSPIGGGGLIAGTSIAINNFSQHCEVIGAEPTNVDDAYRSLISGKIEFNESTNTIAWDS